MDYIFPAVFHANEDGSYTITYPDLPGCISDGKTLSNAIYMAQTALYQWIEYLTDYDLGVPQASDQKYIIPDEGEFVNLVRVDIKDNRAVKRTVSIPKWMDEKVIEYRLSLSRVLQDALYERLEK